MHRTALIVLGLLLAGCTEPQPGPVATNSNGLTSSTATGDPILGEGSPGGPQVPETMHLSDCEGFQTGIYSIDPSGVDSNPREWATGRPGARIIMEGWTCNRVSIGPYERGPIHLLLEYGGWCGGHWDPRMLASESSA